VDGDSILYCIVASGDTIVKPSYPTWAKSLAAARAFHRLIEINRDSTGRRCWLWRPASDGSKWRLDSRFGVLGGEVGAALPSDRLGDAAPDGRTP
jgi:hypothetical protein